MNRLIVNPGTPQAWEIKLRDGTNRLGRSDASDFQISDPSISSSHCDVIVAGGSVLIKDLGSTNGTFIDRSPVQEGQLANGQILRLGVVDIAFYSDGPAPAVAAPAMAAAAGAAPVRLRAVVRVAAPASPPPVSSGETEIVEAPPVMDTPPPPPIPGGGMIPGAGRKCKFHPKSPARYLCNKCNRPFCEMCVTTRTAGSVARKLCRSCGVDLVQLQVRIERPTQRGFFASMPGAFIYPFRGFGWMVLLLAVGGFGGLEYLKSIGFLSGPYGWLIRVAMYGFLFLFMQNIIYSTTSDEAEPLGFPDPDGLFGAAWTLLATVLLSFGIPIGILIANVFFDANIPGEAMIGSTILGCLYFPMAFLAAAMKDTALAANPLVVIPAIIKIPFHYLIASALLMSVFGIRKLAGAISSGAEGVMLTTRDRSDLFLSMGIQAGAAFLSIYLLIVSVRILGLLYNANKEKLGWF